MQAIVSTKYGSADVLQTKEVKIPILKDNEVLVKVYAAAVNPLDWRIMRGAPFIIRLMGSGLFKPKRKILGSDIAGRVESVGKNVSQFKEGDEVFGDVSGGGFAEYVCAPENTIALKPNCMTFNEAAAVPVAALTALQGLRDAGQVQAGQKILIHGASGGVGTFAVQIAKSFGANVTAVCSTQNLDLMRSIGADHVIDYTKEDFKQKGQRYDLILAVAGHRRLSDYKQVLNRTGSWVMIGGSSTVQMLTVMFLRPLISLLGTQKIRTVMTKANQEDLIYIKQLIDAGKLESVIDRTYPLSELADAIGYLEKGHARGKVVIQLQY